MKYWDSLITIEEMEQATASLLETADKVGADTWQQRVKIKPPTAVSAKQALAAVSAPWAPAV